MYVKPYDEQMIFEFCLINIPIFFILAYRLFPVYFIQAFFFTNTELLLINPFHATILFRYPLKTSENL